MIDLLRKRRSIRTYTDRKIEPEKIEILKEALVRSPTSKNSKPWEFILIEDKDMLHKLSQSKPHGASFLSGAALGIVVCGDSKKSDVWIEDCSIASIIVQLVAQSLELGNCWIQIRNRAYDNSKTSEEYIQELLGIPKNIQVESIIAFGYPAKTRPGVLKDDLDSHKIRVGKF